MLGKLDGVTDQVDNDLAEAARIAQQRVRYVAVDLAGQLQPLLVGPQSQGLHGIAKAVAQSEFHAIELEFPRLDFGEIEDVVDDVQKRVGRGFEDRKSVV